MSERRPWGHGHSRGRPENHPPPPYQPGVAGALTAYVRDGVLVAHSKDSLTGVTQGWASPATGVPPE